MSLRESYREVKFKYMLTQRHYAEEQLVASVPFPEAPPDPISTAVIAGWPFLPHMAFPLILKPDCYLSGLVR